MKQALRLVAAATASCLAAMLQAQSLTAPDFSEGAPHPSAAQLEERLAGNIFTATLANGVHWRMDYRSTAGHVFFDISTGARDTARWSAQEGKVCYQFQKAFPSGCTEYRLLGDRLYFKRSSGEVVALEKK